jgi:hypothetical protein
VQHARYAGASYETTLALGNDETIIADLPDRLEIGATVRISIADAWAVPS